MLARDRLAPDTPDLSAQASRALPVTEALTESAVTKPKNHIPPLATAFVVALGLALPGNLST